MTTGLTIARELSLTQEPFVIIEKDMNAINRFLSEFPDLLFINDDATDEKVLKDAGLINASGLVSCLGEDKDNLFVVVTSRGLNQTMRIIVKVKDLKHKNNFMRTGANSVVSPNFIGGMRLVSEMVRPSVVTFLDNMLRERGDVHRIEEVKISKDSSLIGKPAGEYINERLQGCLLMATRAENDSKFTYIPKKDTLITPGMTLILLCNVSGLKNIKKLA